MCGRRHWPRLSMRLKSATMRFQSYWPIARWSWGKCSGGLGIRSTVEALIPNNALSIPVGSGASAAKRLDSIDAIPRLP